MSHFPSRLMPRPSTDLGLLLVRLALAAVFLFHGSQKLFGAFAGYGLAGTAQWLDSIGIPLPMLSATMAASTEFVGGIALLTGVALRWLMLPLFFTMVIAAFVGHAGKGYDVTQGGMEYPFTLMVVTAGLFCSGPGRYAIQLPQAAPEALRT